MSLSKYEEQDTQTDLLEEGRLAPELQEDRLPDELHDPTWDWAVPASSYVVLAHNES
jgi:hypothetical protein